jgi:hypothetical protein
MISEKLKKYRINQNNRYRKKLNSRKEIMEEIQRKRDEKIDNNRSNNWNK